MASTWFMLFFIFEICCCIMRTAQKSFLFRISPVNVSKSAASYTFTFTDEIRNGKLHFLCCGGNNNLYQDSPEHITNGLIKIVSCFKQGNNSVNVFICGILPSDDISPINRLLIKETNNILKSTCSLYHINFIDQDKNWVQRSGAFKPDPLYSD